SGDRAMELLAFWQKVNPDTGRLVHDFTDSKRGTRFLGDLYQDLSESARKRYALLQTPIFVEELILDRTLTPTIDEFGYREVRLIDPTCGSGHFLLGTFQRLFDVWTRHEPARNLRDLAQQALNGVYGVDVNPFAVAIARFRLLLAALVACDETRLKDAPAFTIHLAAGDSLLHGRRFNQLELGREAENLGRSALAHAYQIEDLDEINRILGQQYHVVVGKPPYITVKDAALNAAYRSRYSTCHMKYSLAVPFTERFFELALPGRDRRSAGHVGMITTNSFMKREFGSKLIERFLPRVDLTHVIDTSGAYIPGHGTPTVILFGRDRPPVASTVRTVMGIKGEPATPEDPAQGLVWRAIVTQVDRAGSESAYVSVADTPRATFARHPWTIGGGGAAELKELIEENRETLESMSDSVGITSFTLEDDAFIRDPATYTRFKVPPSLLREMVIGDELRDWGRATGDLAMFAYNANFKVESLPCYTNAYRAMWSYRTNLANNKLFGQQTKADAGMAWWEFGRLTAAKLRTPLSITFAFVATHSHFVLDRGGKVFNRSAPVIKLPANAAEDEHLRLLGLLNSSVACFWLKQVAHNKGSTVDDRGARQRTAPFEDFYEFTGTQLLQFPLTDPQPLDLARGLDTFARELTDTLPAALLARGLPTRASLNAARDRAALIRRQMIALQEELDWRCYRLYDLIDKPLETENPPDLALGQRAFEIVLARRMAEGEETTWFARHGSTPITEVPAHWPEDYRRLVERRIALIESNRNIGLIERPEYKRRWNAAPWEELEQAALRSWLLDRLETDRYWPGGVVV
ncbi:MAG: BREX-2 system adenine-specific DNA-methyltransferase PglX, partial [Gammaproteobacteria bacterium]